MTTAVHYVVRHPMGPSLAQRPSGAWVWAIAAPLKPWRSDSRAEAERLAAEHGGTVHRITVTDEAVGLRWEGEPHWDDCGDEFLLLDGESRRVLAQVEPSHDGRGLWFVTPGGQ